MGSKKRIVPASKLSKKQRQALAKERRVTWAFSPVTRKPEHPKAYRRSRQKQFRDFDFPPDCFFILSLFPIRFCVFRIIFLHFVPLWGIIKNNLSLFSFPMQEVSHENFSAVGAEETHAFL